VIFLSSKKNYIIIPPRFPTNLREGGGEW